MDLQSQESTPPEIGKWYTPLTRETKLSKYFAMVLFIVLPFLGFWWGMGYGLDSIKPFASLTVQEQSTTQSIAGTDSDGNGVRDDIDQYISSTFPESEKRRIAMTLYAREEQTFLTDFLATADDPVEQKRITRANALERRKSAMCLYYILGDVTEDDLRKAFEVRKKLTTQFLNTLDRSEIYLKADILLGGTVGSDLGDPKALCKELGLDPDSSDNSTANSQEGTTTSQKSLPTTRTTDAATYTSPDGRISFSYPTFGKRWCASTTGTQTDTELNVTVSTLEHPDWPTPTQVQYSIHFLVGNILTTKTTWTPDEVLVAFEDSADLLRSSKTYVLERFDNGAQAYVLRGAIPNSYTGGPLGTEV